MRIRLAAFEHRAGGAHNAAQHFLLGARRRDGVRLLPGARAVRILPPPSAESVASSASRVVFAGSNIKATLPAFGNVRTSTTPS